MAQHDYVIDNQTAPNFRSDLNNALLATVSNNSGPSAPSTTYANMMWYDTTNNILKMRNEADDAWIDIGTLNQTTDEFEVANLTTLAESEWEAGTSTTEAIVSPAKVKAAATQTAASAAAGAVGTYLFARIASDVNRGGTVSGSSLVSCSGAFSVEESNTAGVTSSRTEGSLSGTWRCMGTMDNNYSRVAGPAVRGATLWLRIS